MPKNPNVFGVRYLCHLTQIAASHPNDRFITPMNLNSEDVCIDTPYWFYENLRRKDKLAEYAEFFDREYQVALFIFQSTDCPLNAA